MEIIEKERLQETRTISWKLILNIEYSIYTACIKINATKPRIVILEPDEVWKVITFDENDFLNYSVRSPEEIKEIYKIFSDLEG